MSIYQIEHHEGRFGIRDRNGTFLPVRMGGSSVSAFDPGWSPVFITDFFSPVLLLELHHSGGASATWFLDETLDRIGGSIIQLPVDIRSHILGRYAALGLAEVDSALSAGIGTQFDDIDDFRRLNSYTRSSIHDMATSYHDSEINDRISRIVGGIPDDGTTTIPSKSWIDVAEVAYSGGSMSAWLSKISPDTENDADRLSMSTRGLFWAWVGRARLMEHQISAARQAFAKAIATGAELPVWTRREFETAVSQDPGPFVETVPPSLDRELGIFIEIMSSLLHRQPVSYSETAFRFPAFVLAFYWLKAKSRASVLRSITPGSVGEDVALTHLSPNFIKAARYGTHEIAHVCAELCPEIRLPLGEKMSDRLFEVIATAHFKAKPILCPFSGTRQFVTDSLDLSCYLYRHEAKTCIIVSNEIPAAAGNDCGWFVFDENLLFVTEDLARVQSALALTLARTFENRQAVELYLKDTKRSVLVSDISLGHIGHYVWNVISGWSTLFENVVSGGIDVVASTTFPQFFGGVVELYEDKLPLVGEIVRWTHRHELYREIIERRAVCVVLLDRYVTRDLAERVLSWCKSKCPDDSLNAIADIRGRTNHLLLVTLRLDNRCWVDQEDGLVEIFNRLSVAFPDFVAVLDGLNAGTHDLDSHAFMSLEAERELAAKIIARCPLVTIINTIGLPLSESLVWCDTVDAFLAPVGAGMAKYRWITNKPGVAFSNETFLEPDDAGGHLYDHWLESPIPMEYVEPAEVHDVEVRHGEESRANFTMSWEAPYYKIRDLLARLGGRRLG